MSLSTRIIVPAGCVLAVAGVCMKSFGMAALLPVFMLPTLALWLKRQSQSTQIRTDAETMIWTYILTGTVGVAIILILEGILGYFFAALIFQSDLKLYLRELAQGQSEIGGPKHRIIRAEMASTWQYWVFMISFAFIGVGMVEEGVKYYAVVLARRCGRVTREDDYITIAVSAALGFATFEIFGFVFAASQDESLTWTAVTIFERVVLGCALHTMVAALVSINIIARDLRHEARGLWWVLRLPVLFHGSFDFTFFAISALNGNLGWVHPKEGPTLYLIIAVATSFFAALAFTLNCKCRQYNIRY